MNFTWQDVAVVAAVSWAAWRLGRAAWRTIAKARGADCGGSCGCGAPRSPGQTLVSITPEKKA